MVPVISQVPVESKHEPGRPIPESPVTLADREAEDGAAGKTLGKPWGKPWGKHGKIMGKSLENHGKILRFNGF
jgi:hypothetical protein